MHSSSAKRYPMFLCLFCYDHTQKIERKNKERRERDRREHDKSQQHSSNKFDDIYLSQRYQFSLQMEMDGLIYRQQRHGLQFWRILQFSRNYFWIENQETSACLAPMNNRSFLLPARDLHMRWLFHLSSTDRRWPSDGVAACRGEWTPWRWRPRRETPWSWSLPPPPTRCCSTSCPC